MNYERIILELLERIQVLEEKVEALEQCGKSVSISLEKEPAGKKVNLTAEARNYIMTQKKIAKQQGLASVVLVCNDIQKALGTTNRAPAICAAMYACMGQGDEVVFAPPSGKSTTVTIKYVV